MATKKSADQERSIGGGLALLPSDAEPSSMESFSLYKAYSLADRAFCVEPGLVSDAITQLNLLRMDDIYQLQLLTVAEIGSALNNLELPHRFLHKRLEHNLRAGALHGLIAEDCGRSEEEIAIGVLADCMHDNFTCAGGDSWKVFDHQETIFDEDHKFAEKIFRYYDSGWRALSAKYKFDPKKTAEDLQDIVDGRGLAGQIHEIADTASYLLGDLAEIKKAYMRLGGRKLQNIILISQDDWHIWNYLDVANGQLVVTNPGVLENFLRLRVMLWANLYQNPAAKFLELLNREIVYPYLLNRKRISLAELPLRGDTWLQNLVEREMGLPSGAWTHLDLLGGFPKRMSCATWSQALDFEDQVYALGGFTLVFSTKDFQATKSKTDKYFVKGCNGNTLSFREAFSSRAELIDDLANLSTSQSKTVNVCWVEEPVIPNNLRQAWEEARARWRQKK